MKNIVPHSINGVSYRANTVRAGLVKLKDVLTLHYVDAEGIAARREELIAANGDYEQGKLRFADQQAIMTALTKEARTLVMIVREMLKPLLGCRYGRLWDSAGFRNSLETPRSFDELSSLMLMMSLHLETYSAEEQPALALMSGKAKDLDQRMKEARARFTSVDTDLVSLLQVRTEKVKELRRYLRMAIDELHLLLAPMDVRWGLFGLNKPGAKQTPPAPEKVEVKVIDNNRAEITWPAPPRAQYYRVWRRIEGVDAEPVAVGSPKDADFMLEALTVRATVEISVSAVNSGGESARSVAVVFTTV